MAETRKIKVKRVQVADPQLIVDLESEDGGTFPNYVSVSADIYCPQDQNTYFGMGSAPGGGTAVTVTATFTDANFDNETSVDYALGIGVSSNGLNWGPFQGTVDGATGSAPVTHSN